MDEFIEVPISKFNTAQIFCFHSAQTVFVFSFSVCCRNRRRRCNVHRVHPIISARGYFWKCELYFLSPKYKSSEPSYLSSCLHRWVKEQIFLIATNTFCIFTRCLFDISNCGKARFLLSDNPCVSYDMSNKNFLSCFPDGDYSQRCKGY